jgi:hypothetical protein
VIRSDATRRSIRSRRQRSLLTTERTSACKHRKILCLPYSTLTFLSLQISKYLLTASVVQMFPPDNLKLRVIRAKAQKRLRLFQKSVFANMRTSGEGRGKSPFAPSGLLLVFLPRTESGSFKGARHSSGNPSREELNRRASSFFRVACVVCPALVCRSGLVTCHFYLKRSGYRIHTLIERAGVGK